MTCNNCENVYPGKIIKCDKDGKCEDCERQVMTTTPISEEITISNDNWEKRFSETYDFYEPDNKSQLIDFIRNLLQNQNNALVAEIEKLRVDYRCSDCSSGYECTCKERSHEENKALDTIIRIIQEK